MRYCGDAVLRIHYQRAARLHLAHSSRTQTRSGIDSQMHVLHVVSEASCAPEPIVVNVRSVAIAHFRPCAPETAGYVDKPHYRCSIGLSTCLEIEFVNGCATRYISLSLKYRPATLGLRGNNPADRGPPSTLFIRSQINISSRRSSQSYTNLQRPIIRG